MSDGTRRLEGGGIDDLMIEDEAERQELVKSVERIRDAATRNELASSDGGSSGRSDTNDLQE